MKPGSHPLSEHNLPEWMPTNTLARQIAQARKEMGEAKWKALNADWEHARRNV